MRILPTRISRAPGGPHRELNNLLPVFGLTNRQQRLRRHGWRRRTNVWREPTSPARGRMLQRAEDGSAAQFLSHRPSWRAPLRGQRCRSFTALWRRESRAEAEHELAPSRAVFFPPACRLRGVTGYYLRGHPEVFKKPLPTQVHTRRGSAARTALKYTPLAAGGDEQTFGAK